MLIIIARGTMENPTIVGFRLFESHSLHIWKRFAGQDRNLRRQRPESGRVKGRGQQTGVPRREQDRRPWRQHRRTCGRRHLGAVVVVEVRRTVIIRRQSRDWRCTDPLLIHFVCHFDDFSLHFSRKFYFPIITFSKFNFLSSNSSLFTANSKLFFSRKSFKMARWLDDDWSSTRNVAQKCSHVHTSGRTFVEWLFFFS